MTEPCRVCMDMIRRAWRETYGDLDITQATYVKAWLTAEGGRRAEEVWVLLDEVAPGGEDLRGWIDNNLSQQGAEGYIQFPRQFVVQHISDDHPLSKAEEEIQAAIGEEGCKHHKSRRGIRMEE